MTKVNYDVAYTILARMVSLKIWKSNHIKYDNLKHCGFPKNRLGEVEKTIDFLIKSEYIIYYNKSKKAVQLNWNKRGQIMDIIQSESYNF